MQPKLLRGIVYLRTYYECSCIFLNLVQGYFYLFFGPGIAFWMLTYWFGLFSGSSPALHAHPARTAPCSPTEDLLLEDFSVLVSNKYF